jgi:hypothetical protein
MYNSCNSSKTLTLEIYDMMGTLLTERNIEAESNKNRFLCIRYR